MEATIGKMPEKLILEVDNTFDKLVHAITRFDEKQFNTIPFAGSWTAGQVVKHVTMSVAQLPDQKTEISNRAYDEKVSTIKKLFLDFSIKMESPEFIVPEHVIYNKEALIIALKDIQHQHIEAIKELDLTELCMDFELPTYGYLTRYEWLNFFIFHTQRHTRQVNNIYQNLSDTGL